MTYKLFCNKKAKFPLQAEVFKLQTTKLTVIQLVLALVPVIDLTKSANMYTNGYY